MASASQDTTDYQITHFAVDLPKNTDIVLRASAGVFSHFTMGQLDAMATQTQPLFERFINKQVTFRGIPLKALFKEIGIRPSDKLVFTAADEYRYSDSAANLLKSHGILAVEMNGNPITADQGGPIRIVFPDDTKYSAISDPWVWSLTRITKVG